MYMYVHICSRGGRAERLLPAAYPGQLIVTVTILITINVITISSTLTISVNTITISMTLTITIDDNHTHLIINRICMRSASSPRRPRTLRASPRRPIHDW